MSISTSYYFNHAVRLMNEQQASIAKTQTQLSTGLQLTKPSDDPVKVTAIGRLNTAIARQDSYASSLAIVGDRLQAAEATVKSASDAMTRIKELTIRAANDTFGAADRGGIAAELASLREELISLASSRDINGNHLFSGTRAGQAPFAESPNGSIEYVGDQISARVSVGDQREIIANRPGTEVFSSATRDSHGNPEKIGFFKVLDDLISAVRASNTTGMQRGLGEIDQITAGLTQALAQVGADLSIVDAQKSRVDDTKLRLQTTLSALADSDYAQTITKLQKEMLGLQAMQSSFAKTTDLNLFNYLK